MESSSTNNDDGNDNNKKKKRFISKTTVLNHTLRYFFLPRLALQDYNLRLPNPMSYGGRENTTKNFPFSFWTWIQPFRIQLQENSPLFDKLKPAKTFQSN